MNGKPCEADLQRYITDQIEEDLHLEYKSASSLGREDNRKREITKDVSALANAAGGRIIYGISHKQGRGQSHLPESLDPIDASQFSSEWLGQVINSIEPAIPNVNVHTVELSSASAHVAYVVDVPAGSTAHQAGDRRYYRRHGQEVLQMHHHEILEVMYRRQVPDVTVQFGYRKFSSTAQQHHYALTIRITNASDLIVNHWKLEFTFPNPLGANPPTKIAKLYDHIRIRTTTNGDYTLTYFSPYVLYPREDFDIGQEIAWRYQVDDAICRRLDRIKSEGNPLTLSWSLFADTMPSKTGEIDISDLHEF